MRSVAVDIGGTFTDLFVYDDTTGASQVAKGPSTPHDPSLGVIQVLEKAGIDMREVGFFAHGSTIATNALIQRKTAKTGLLTTKGFRDTLEIRKGNKEDLWDFYKDVAPAPIRRRDRLEVKERINYAGKILTPLDEEDVRRAARIFQQRGMEAIAVCFVNSYVSGVHERRAKEILRELLPGVHISVSHEILPEIYEFERTNTTVINATLAPTVSTYLKNLEERLKQKGYRHDVLVIHSGGGVMTVQAAAELAGRVANSGPAAGAAAGAAIAKLCGYENAITLDMGGTSADISLTYKGQTRRAGESYVDFGYPLRFPCVDIVAIGAGGGSVAWIDSGGALRNGPQSMGADPGPACFAKGGTEPTNTDANVLLGRLSENNFLGGDMRVKPDLSLKAVKEKIADPLGYNIMQAADAIIQVANANMADAVRLISLRKGYDPREFVLVVFGGAGPLHGAYLAKELNIPTVIVPPWPGVTSAFGCLMVDLMHDFSKSVTTSMNGSGVGQFEKELKEMEEEALARLKDEGVPPDKTEILRYLDMRYLGQWRSLTIPCPRPLNETTLEQARELFHQEHGREYMYSMKDQAVEIHGLRVTGLGKLAKPQFKRCRRGSGESGAVKARRRVYFSERGTFVDTRIYDRQKLLAGEVLEGSAIVEQMDSTVLIPPDMRAEIDDYGNIRIHIH